MGRLIYDVRKAVDFVHRVTWRYHGRDDVAYLLGVIVRRHEVDGYRLKDGLYCRQLLRVNIEPNRVAEIVGYIERKLLTVEAMYKHLKVKATKNGEQKFIHPPLEAVGLVITPNPRNLVRATQSTVKAVLDAVFNGSEYELTHLDRVWLSNIHRHAYEKCFITFDVDTKDKGYANALCAVLRLYEEEMCVITTPNGYHILLRTSKEGRGKLYREVINNPNLDLLQRKSEDGKPLCEIKPDPIEPIPGTVYKGYEVKAWWL